MSRVHRVQVIVNPVSGRPKSRSALEGLCERFRQGGIALDVQATRGPGDARRLAERACKNGVDLLVVSGGDGTISQVVDGLVGEGVPILVVPGGTANILGKYFDTCLDADWLWQVVQDGRIVRMDVPQRDGTRFLMVAGAGFDAEAVRVMSERRRGHISYLNWVGPLWQTFWGHGFPPLRVEADGVVVHEGPGLALVGNVPRYATGMRVFERAMPDDGLLDLCVLSCRGRGRLVWHALRVLSQQHEGSPGVVYRQAKRIRIESASRVPVQLDGDVAGWLPAEFTLADYQARFLVSAGWRMPGSE